MGIMCNEERVFRKEVDAFQQGLCRVFRLHVQVKQFIQVWVVRNVHVCRACLCAQFHIQQRYKFQGPGSGRE
jgi:hypothetical protein